MHGCEPLNSVSDLQSNSLDLSYKPNFPVQREPSDGEDLAYFNYDVTNEEQLDFPEKESDLNTVKVS